MRNRTLGGVLVAVAASSCGGHAGSTRITSAHGWWDPPSERRGDASSAPATAPAARSPSGPSGYFLVDRDRLAALRRDPRATAGGAWDALLANVEEALRSSDVRRTSAENLATAYLVTHDPRYLEAAYRHFEVLAKKDVRFDSYLTFGDLMRPAAFVLAYGRDGLSPQQRARIADYLETWTHELWFDTRGSKWGLADPANNYHYAFLEGTAYAALALQGEGRPSATRFLELLRDKIERADGVLAHLVEGGRGGDWHEGANYGERSKQRMFSAFAAIASMGGPDYFARTPFPDEAVLYAAYQVQPGRGFLAPNGDLPRDVRMDVTPFDREYVQLAGHFSKDARTRGLAAWYLDAVAPTYLMKAVTLRGSLYRDVLLSSPGAPTAPAPLPLGYRSPGTDWLNARSSWSDDAASLTVVATPRFTQSHAHIDTGSFVLWQGGWQAVDAGSYGRSGLSWSASAHNMIHVDGHARSTGTSRGLVRYVDDGRLFYVQIDGTNVLTRRAGERYVPVLEEWTRELVFLRPRTLLVYDRVVPKADTGALTWRMHFAARPTLDGRHLVSTNGAGAIAVTMLAGGEARVASDADLPDGPSRAWRLEVAPGPEGRFLAHVEVAGGATVPARSVAPVTGAGVQGAIFGDQVVVFGSAPLGAPAPLPLTYRVAGSGHHAHTVVDLEPGTAYDVAVSRDATGVTVRLTRGTRHRSDTSGLVRFDD